MGGIRWERVREMKEWRWRRRRRRQREGLRCEAESSASLSDADRDTFAPELWNCVVWNWNGGASGAVICNKFQLLQHFEGAPLPLPSPRFLLLRIFQLPQAIFLLSLIPFISLSLSLVSLFCSSFCLFSLLFSPSLSTSLLHLSLHCWYPLGLLSVVSRLDSWRPGLASPPQASLILIFPPASH